MERPIIVASIVCPVCGASARADELRCAKCGAVHRSLDGARASAHVPDAGQNSLRSVMDSRWQLLLLLFGAMGVLGLPLLWFSRGFGLGGKLGWSLLVTLWTALLVGLCWWSLTWSASRLGISL